MRIGARRLRLLVAARGFPYTAPDVSDVRPVLVGALLLAGACTPASLPPSPSAVPPTPPMDSCAAKRSAETEIPDMPDRKAAVATFLNSDGDPETLAQALIDLGWGPFGSAVVVTDLDGDRDQDVAMALLEPASDGTPTGTGVVWRCQDGAFQASVVAPGLAEFGPPELLRVVDMTGDGVPELLFRETRCGAHTCFGRLSVLQFDGQAWQNRFGGPSDDLPSPEWEITPAIAGQTGEIASTAQGIGSVGAGPYRRHTRRWTWDPEASTFRVRGDSVEAPRFRIHQIHDADDAFATGDWPTALSGYERAIRDDALLDWPEPGAGREALAGYAAYRRVLVYLAMHDTESALREYEDRLRSAPGAAAPYLPLAEAALAQASADGLAAACAEIVRLVEVDPGPVLDPLHFGYANRTYTPGDLCPIG